MPGNISVGPADAAPAVKDLAAGRQAAEEAGQIVLVPADGLGKGLAHHAVGKVEGRAPAHLVEQRRQLIVGVNELCIRRVTNRGIVALVQRIVLVNPAVDDDLALLFLADEGAEKVDHAGDWALAKLVLPCFVHQVLGKARA
jgi:hypothetical protein